MRKNYEFTKCKSIGRVHSQTIISTSQLIGQLQLSNSPHVLECLAMLNSLALSDKTYRNSCLSVEIQDLTKRIKNILQATSKMKNFQVGLPPNIPRFPPSMANKFTNGKFFLKLF